jgi:hypothetical protein
MIHALVAVSYSLPKMHHFLGSVANAGGVAHVPQQAHGICIGSGAVKLTIVKPPEKRTPFQPAGALAFFRYG